MWAYRINYLTLIILVIAGLLFYNNYALLLLLVMLILLPVISYLIIRNSRDKIEADIQIEKTSVGKNTPVGVSFNVINKSIMPVENFTLYIRIYNAFYENDEIYEIRIPATPFNSRKATLKISGIYCGRMIVKIEKIKCYDMFGMFRKIYDLDKSAEITILPYDSVELEELPLSLKGASDDEELQYVKGDDVSQISQIRNYVPGDKLQNIHWKLSAKAEELQVKEFSMPYSEDVILLVERYIDRDFPEVFDELIEKMFAIAVFLTKQRRKFYMEWYDSVTEDFIKKEINNEDEIMSAIIDFYYGKGSVENGMAYELFRRINDSGKGTVIYLSDKNQQNVSGDEIDIGSERVVLKCLY